MTNILKKGIKYNIFINKLIINSFIKKSLTIIDDVIDPKNVPKDIKSKFVKSIEKSIIKNIKKLNIFVTK